jgi:predicted lipid-binding transport protein (Tim44 family)
MDDGLTLLNIILLAVAVGVFLKLRSVLGRRTGHERPPFDPYSQTGSVPEKRPGNDKVVTLPTRPRDAGSIDAAGDPFAGTARAFRWRGVADEGSPLAARLDEVAAVDRSFTAEGFLSGARMAYEMIVTAFAAGDRASLKPKKLTVDQSFIGIDKAKITDASVTGTRVRITVAFRSELTSCTRKDDGVVVEGDPVTVREVNDVWTFERDATSRDPNWLLVATSAAAD